MHTRPSAERAVWPTTVRAAVQWSPSVSGLRFPGLRGMRHGIDACGARLKDRQVSVVLPVKESCPTTPSSAQLCSSGIVPANGNAHEFSSGTKRFRSKPENLFLFCFLKLRTFRAGCSHFCQAQPSAPLLTRFPSTPFPLLRSLLAPHVAVAGAGLQWRSL